MQASKIGLQPVLGNSAERPQYESRQLAFETEGGI
jgi:hypothetical protein